RDSSCVGGTVSLYQKRKTCSGESIISVLIAIVVVSFMAFFVSRSLTTASRATAFRETRSLSESVNKDIENMIAAYASEFYKETSISQNCNANASSFHNIFREMGNGFENASSNLFIVGAKFDDASPPSSTPDNIVDALARCKNKQTFDTTQGFQSVGTDPI